MARCGLGRAVRVVGRHDQEQRLVGRGAPDHLRGPARQDVGQMVLGLVAVADQPAVLVQRVVEIGEPAADAVPLVPAGLRRVDLRLVAVQQLAQKGGAVAGGVQPGRDRRPVQLQRLELGEPARRQVVALDAVIVRVLAAQDGGARGAAERVGHEVVGEHDALVGDQRLGPLHDPVGGEILVVGQDHDDAGARGGRGADGGRRDQRQRGEGDPRPMHAHPSDFPDLPRYRP